MKLLLRVWKRRTKHSIVRESNMIPIVLEGIEVEDIILLARGSGL